jgi:cytochrome c biogenesis protein CcdA
VSEAAEARAAAAPASGWRTPLALGAAVAVLALALLAALATGSGLGPAAGVESIAAGAQRAVQQVGERLPFGYAFAAGMVAAVNPCGFSLLPAYLGLYLGDGRRAPSRALAISGAVTVSFLALFGAAGLVLSAATSAVVAWFPWASLAVGVFLTLAGASSLAGRPLYHPLPERLGDRLGPAAQSGVLRYFAYGLAFALCSLSCTLPIFLTVVGSALTVRGFVPALAGFLLYGLGMSLVLAVLTAAAAIFKSTFLRANVATAWTQSLSGVLLLVTGAYVVYYWLTLGGLLPQ